MLIVIDRAVIFALETMERKVLKRLFFHDSFSMQVNEGLEFRSRVHAPHINQCRVKKIDRVAGTTTK